MAKLVYFPCKCIRRGNAFVPGTRGTIALETQGKRIHVQHCRYCGNVDSSRKV